MCSPSNPAVVDSPTSQASLWNYIYSQMLGRKTGMGLITHDITFLEISKYLLHFPYFFLSVSMENSATPTIRKKEKKTNPNIHMWGD